MKKPILILFTAFLMLLHPILGVNASEKGMPSSDALDGYENVCLTYTFDYFNSSNDKSSHTVEDLLPYIGYYDREGEVKDYFFDSFLFLPCVTYGPSGASMFASFDEPTVALDWTAYVSDTFKDGYNVSALNEAFGIVKEQLGDKSDKKAGVFFSILYPTHTSTEFGSLDGRDLNFSNKEDRKFAIKWIIDEQLKLFEEGGYENLDVVGFYWIEEYLLNYELTEEDIELFLYTADYLHSKGLKFIWIPWYMAYGANRWDEFGFDVACMQPNLFWMTNPDYDRVKDSVQYSKEFGMGMEMELDPLAFHSQEHFKRYLIYLEDGMKYGAMDSIKMYYQDKKSAVFYQASRSDSFNKRVIYDLTYKYAKGTLTQSDIDKARDGLYPSDNTRGDINGDGIIDMYDYILCKRIYFGTYNPKDNEKELADANRDDIIDMFDYILLKRHYLGTYIIK